MSNVVTELRRIAGDLDAERFSADYRVDYQMQKIKQKFIEDLRKSPVTRHLDAEKVWRKLEPLIRDDMTKHPLEWRSE